MKKYQEFVSEKLATGAVTEEELITMAEKDDRFNRKVETRGRAIKKVLKAMVAGSKIAKNENKYSLV